MAELLRWCADLHTAIANAFTLLADMATRDEEPPASWFPCTPEFEAMLAEERQTLRAGEELAAAVSIARVLAMHDFWWANHNSIGSDAHCRCGERPHDLRAWREHVAPLIWTACAPKSRA